MVMYSIFHPNPELGLIQALFRLVRACAKPDLILVLILFYTTADSDSLENGLKERESVLVPASNLVDKVWGDSRPPRPCNEVFPLEIKYTGKSTKDKLAGLREEIRKKKATSTIITQLDEIAWLFNLRGSDIPYNPGKICLPLPLACLNTNSLFRIRCRVRKFGDAIHRQKSYKCRCSCRIRERPDNHRAV